jgi:ABC-type glutathione transport system ATPase component
MKASETQDRFKRFENVEAVKGTNLEIEDGGRIVLHNGLPFVPTSTGGAAVNASETLTSAGGAAVNASETLTSAGGAAVTETDGIAIRATDLVKKFRDFVAVDHISFEVKKGEIFGFLGPNGAGKTTTIRMLCTLSSPTQGSATVAGFDVAHQGNRVREHIGLVSEKMIMYDRLTAYENLRLFGELYDIPRDALRERIDELLQVVAHQCDPRPPQRAGDPVLG